MPPESIPVGTNWISIQTENGPFCGRCDNTKLIVQEDGLVQIEQGHWLLNHRFWQTSRRAVRIEPEAVSALRSHLERFRPEGTLDLRDSDKCETCRSHSGGARIQWNDAASKDQLYADFGCQSETHPVSRCDVSRAVALLGIENLNMREWRGITCN